MGASKRKPVSNLTLTQLSEEIYPHLHQLREQNPIVWIPALNGWLITRRDLAIQVMRDAKRFTVDHPGFTTGQVVGPSMLSLDGTEHQRHRTPFEKPFRKREVESRFQATVSESLTRLIDKIYSDGRGELRRAVAGPISVEVMIVALGMEQAATAEILGWYDKIVDAVTRLTAGEALSTGGKESFEALKKSLLPIIVEGGESSLLGAASGLAHRLSADQIVSNAAVLLFGGIETTEGMIANGLYHLLTNRPVLEMVYNDLSLIPAVVEESLRLEPAASVIDRYTTEDVELAGVTLNAGDLVRISLTAANRDPTIFQNPDRFDPLRPNLGAHVTFAQGPHVCLGLHLARLEAEQSLKEILLRLPDLALDPAELGRAIPQGLVFRKPDALFATWRP